MYKVVGHGPAGDGYQMCVRTLWAGVTGPKPGLQAQSAHDFVLCCRRALELTDFTTAYVTKFSLKDVESTRVRCAAGRASICSHSQQPGA